MKAAYYPSRDCWRVIIPARLSPLNRRQDKYFRTKEEAEQVIQLLPKINRVEQLEIAAKIEPILAAIKKLTNDERWNLMRRLRRAYARKGRETARQNGLKIQLSDHSESTIRYRSNIQHRLRVCLGNRLNELVKAGKANGGRIIDLLGCTIPEFMTYLEGQFVEGMTWNNYGPVWHIDHIQPCSSFDLRDPEQQKRCFHWTNLKALLAIENLRKGKNLISSAAGRSDSSE